jgi:hypothetical protein
MGKEMSSITRDQAEDLLHDLIFAYDDACDFPKKPDYYDDYVKQRERIIEALMFGNFPIKAEGPTP